MLLAAAGCSQKPDLHMAKLETRVENIAQAQSDLESRFTNLLGIVQEMGAQSQKSTTQVTALLLQQQENWNDLQRAFGELRASLTRHAYDPAHVCLRRWDSTEPDTKLQGHNEGRSSRGGL